MSSYIDLPIFSFVPFCLYISLFPLFFYFLFLYLFFLLLKSVIDGDHACLIFLFLDNSVFFISIDDNLPSTMINLTIFLSAIEKF